MKKIKEFIKNNPITMIILIIAFITMFNEFPLF